ncbi:MAG: metallophosphoesterase [Solirubrobacteraceae bacterium]
MARTLVISDLHLGGRRRHAVLTRRAPLERLLAEVERTDRLVLLGDSVELMEGRQQQAMEVAAPIMKALGAQLGGDREVIVVPGNHDWPLVSRWVRSRGAQLGLASPVPLDASPVLEQIVSWLRPAHVGISYPGVWLRAGVWATHGHYLDQHLLPEGAYGITRGLLGRGTRDQATPFDYERRRRPSLGRATGMLPHPLARLVDDVSELIRASTMPRIRRRVLHRRIAPLTSKLLGAQMRRASIPALAHVVHRLGLEADWVLFGHVHRLGPLVLEDPTLWRGPDGWPRIANSGSWLYEPLLIHRACPPHPYWPGGAIVLEDGSDPRAVGLLDEVAVGDLR